MWLRRITLAALALIMMVNVFTTSALAGSCMNAPTAQAANMPSTAASTNAQSINHGQSASMPCHEMAEQKPDSPTTPKQKHCDGICLCLHMAATQAQILSADNNIAPPFGNYERIFNPEHQLSSLKAAPPHRPPKHLS